MGSKQLVFSSSELYTAKKQTEQEKFPTETRAAVTWQKSINLIELRHNRISQ